MSVCRAAFVSPALSLLLAMPAAAQTAAVEVRVTDPDRAVVVSAPVILTQLPSGTPRTELTGSQGTARFTGLTPGEYRLEIAARNFETHVQTLALAAGDRLVGAPLKIASFQQDVTVEVLPPCRPSAGSIHPCVTSRSRCTH